MRWGQKITKCRRPLNVLLYVTFLSTEKKQTSSGLAEDTSKSQKQEKWFRNDENIVSLLLRPSRGLLLARNGPKKCHYRTQPMSGFEGGLTTAQHERRQLKPTNTSAIKCRRKKKSGTAWVERADVPNFVDNYTGKCQNMPGFLGRPRKTRQKSRAANAQENQNKHWLHTKNCACRVFSRP